MKSELFKGTIVAMRRQMVTRISFLEIVDDDKGPTLIPCEGTPLVKAFHKAFGGGVIVDGKFCNDGIAGERIAYRVDEKGYIAEFIHEANPKTTWFPGGGAHTRRGFLPPDHALYSVGPIVAGREILKPPKKDPPSGQVRHINEGLAKPDDPISSSGPVVQGRPILKRPPKRKPSENN